MAQSLRSTKGLRTPTRRHFNEQCPMRASGAYPRGVDSHSALDPRQNPRGQILPHGFLAAKLLRVLADADYRRPLLVNGPWDLRQHPV